MLLFYKPYPLIPLNPHLLPKEIEQKSTKLTNKLPIGKISGCTVLIPNNSPVNSVSCFANASFHFGVGCHGFPAASRAPPRKKGWMSTLTPWARRPGRCLRMLVKPNQE